MLQGISIRDIVLIEQLDIDFREGLCVLTGETGAGKTILLDALGLVAGGRGDSMLVRQNSGQGVVAATFSISANHPVKTLMAEHGLTTAEGDLILRRIITVDGRSRAWVNDQPVSISLLRDLGDTLIEIHGQHDDRGLLNPKSHGDLLDAFGGHSHIVRHVEEAWHIFKEAETHLKVAHEKLQEAARDEDYLRHNLAELETLDPAAGEEERLADQRASMMRGEKLADDLADIHTRLLVDGGIDASLRSVVRRLERMAEGADDVKPVTEALGRAAIEAEEGIAALEQLQSSLGFDPARLDNAEQRLFALRAVARKHHCSVDALANMKAEFAASLQALDQGNDEIAGLEKQVADCRKEFAKQVLALRAVREKAAAKLDQAVAAELPSLKLEKARFRTSVIPLDEDDWNGRGGEHVAFEISTNPGAPFGPLIRIASGGELSRFILALKVVLSQNARDQILIFDEVDRGLGGAVAAAVGDRLYRLARGSQVLVVTHSPQVAAKGEQHFRISKLSVPGTDGDQVQTGVAELNMDERREEIARMLSGASVTDEARAAAGSLIGEMRAAE